MDALARTFIFPSSALLAVGFLLVTFAVYHFGRDNKVVRMLGNVHTAQVLLALGAVLLAIEGTFSITIHSTEPFVVYALVLMTSLSFALLNGIRRKAKAGFILNHLGILVIIWAALFGAPDVQRLKMLVGKEQPENLAVDSERRIVTLPFAISLEEFSIDYYDDGVSPKQFRSKLVIGEEKMETSVNSPCSYDGFTIFQNGYDEEEGRYTILELVHDPWLPIVYLGMILLAAGSVMLLFGKWKAKITIPATFILTVLFTALTIAKINLGTLMPALRSWWFVPHLFIYMVAYSLMAFAIICIIATKIRGGNHGMDMADRLVRSSAALLIIGMLTGSVWARQAWGDYWAWDPKENWAAVTWFVTLLYLHLTKKNGTKGTAIILLAFLALQITWYGVNFLPSAINSLHSYYQ